MIKAVRCGLSALLLVLAASSAMAQKAANESAAPKQGGLSDRTVRVLASYAWAHIPDEVSKPDGTRIKVVGVAIDKFMLSMEDHRRIVRIAERSAQAKICGMNDLERANHARMMKLEEESKRWSNEQLAWIHWLHEITVKVRVFDPKDASKRVKDMGLEGEAAKKAIRDAKRYKTPACSGDKRQQVQKEISEFVGS